MDEELASSTLRGDIRKGAPAESAGAPFREESGLRSGKPRPDPGSGGDQTWPAFSSAEQQVSTIRRVTRYGSTLAFGRRSSM
nr:hypothetical protein GCM10010350_07500 [Streptomyces galilaeus]